MIFLAITQHVCFYRSPSIAFPAAVNALLIFLIKNILNTLILVQTDNFGVVTYHLEKPACLR